MVSDHDSDEIALAQEVKRIVQSLFESGPKDIYQLSGSERPPEEVKNTVQFLLDHELLVERSDYPRATEDPYTAVYALPSPGFPAKKRGRLREW